MIRKQERKYQSKVLPDKKIKPLFRKPKVASLHLESKIEIILRRFFALLLLVIARLKLFTQ